MRPEHEHAALKEFYIKERLPLLEKDIWNLYQQRNQTNFTVKHAELLASLVEEFNQGLDFAHAKKAAYLPHLRIGATPDLTLSQYVPAIEDTTNLKKSSPFFESGPASGLIKPRVYKEASFEDQPELDISFLTLNLEALSTDIQNEQYRSPQDEFEIIVYQSEDMTDSDIQTVYDMYGIETEEDDDQSTSVDILDGQVLDESEDFELGEIFIFFDENIEPGMLLLELANPENDEVDVLYVPHIPMNFKLITSLVGEHRFMGADVALTLSLADKNNNLLLPIDPNNPNNLIDPNLN